MSLISQETLKTILIVIAVMFIYNKLSSTKEGYSIRYSALSGANNMVLTDEKGNLSSIQFPKGIIVAWTGTIAPEGWALCDGTTNGTPDLRGRFILGLNSNTNKNPGFTVSEITNTGGAERVTLTPGQMPKHSHTADTNSGGQKGDWPPGAQYGTFRFSAWNDIRNTSEAGNNESHENMPPFYTLAYIMKL